MKKKRLFFWIILFFGCQLYPSQDRDILRTIIHHIALREKASFTRLAPLTNCSDDLLVSDYEQWRGFTDQRIYKVGPEQGYQTYNPVMHVAKKDLNFCARFLKLLKKYTKVVITDGEIPGDIYQSLFKADCNSILLHELSREKLDQVTSRVISRLAAQNEFSIIVTSLKSGSALLHQRLWAKLDNVIIFDLDDLLEVLCQDDQDVVDIARFHALMSRNVVIVSTAAILPKRYEERKQQYIYSIRNVLDLGYEPYLLENCAQGPTFLDDHSAQVIYAQNNDPTFTNIGINESRSLIKFFEVCSNELSDDDIIVKLTGRYYFKDDTFLRLIEDHPCFDGFIKHGPYMRYFDLFTGMFALKCSYFKNMLETMNYAYMEPNRICVEWNVGKYFYDLTERHVSIKYIDELHLYGVGFYNGANTKLQYW